MFLTAAELPTYYAPGAQMDESEAATYLQRANGYCLGQIGGNPPVLDWDTDRSNLKSIVAMAFEILAEGQSGQTNTTNGNITVAAPTPEYTRSDRNANPLATVDKMLAPYKAAYERQNAVITDRGFMFLGG